MLLEFSNNFFSSRSPDSSLLHYFLWAYLKSEVYFNTRYNIDILKIRIKEEIEHITPEVMQNVADNFQQHFYYCHVANGFQFEH